MRDRQLERWVEQPPAEPIVQYLRDAERERAISLLGHRERVLDVASEVNVTRALDAHSVTRLDFAASATDHARDTLADAAHVVDFDHTDPRNPRLPYPDDHFDGAVSLGPYDWKFLDAETLTAELRRVVAPDGAFVFSTPTPRSPYHVGGKRILRYYTPRDALALVFPGWRLTGRELVYQYHYRVQDQLVRLDERLQRPFAALADRLTDLHTTLDRWSNASYLVLRVTPTDYRDYCERALERLFTPVDEGGLWEPGGGTAPDEPARTAGGDVPSGEVAVEDDRLVADDGHLVRGLAYEPNAGGDGDDARSELSWTPLREVRWRYPTFALAGLLEWRDSAIGHDGYDRQLGEQLSYFERAVDDHLGAMPAYGVGPLTAGFAIAAQVFDDERERWLTVARRLFEESRDAAFTHAEESLLPYGWSYLYDATGDEAVHEACERALWAIADRQGPNGVFVFENETTRRHQNQMYACWGLCRAIETTGLTGFLDDAERVLEFTVDERMREDGAFVWEEVPTHQRARARLRRLRDPDRRPPHWEFLYECHQTFFVNAVAHYYAAGGDRDLDVEVGRAMNWVFGDNDLDTDLVSASGIGLPLRFLTADGRYARPADQRYKGTYEVGSWVAALTHLCEPNLFGPDARRARRDPELRREDPTLL